MNADVLERLAALSPAPPFPTEVRRAMLADILGASTPATSSYPVALLRRPRRRSLIGAAVAGAAAAAVVVPALLPVSSPGGATPAAAAELHRIAGITGDGAPLGPGEFRYARATSTQTGFPDADHHRPAITLTGHDQSWSNAAGDVWSVHDGVSEGKPYHDVAYASGKDGVGDLSALPTEPATLERYLRAHASGSTSVDEAVYSVIYTIVASTAASPALRSAAIDVLALNGHVTVMRDALDSLGRQVERFDFLDPVNRPTFDQFFSFDPHSGQVLESGDTYPGRDDLGTIEETAVVSAIPVDVVKAAADATALNKRLIQPDSGG